MGHAVPAIPGSLRENLAYGLGAAEADRWLAEAVDRAEQLFDVWDLEPVQVLAGGSESLCVKCTGADGDTVLKLPASVPGGADEIAALRAWDGNGAPRVLRTEPEHSAMLLPFLGWVGEGDYTLPEVLELADRLHGGEPEGYDFPSLEANLDRRVEWARDRFAEVDDEEALADVDPLPAVGPALFDLALYVVKCVHDHALTTCQDEVLDLRPDLDADLLRRWCWALAVLESRPYLGDLNARRVECIRQFRDAL